MCLPTKSRLWSPLFLLDRTVLTRKNSIVEYRDDPTIFGREIINEPRCITDISGDTLQIVLTKKNSIGGIEYRDDPTIFGWELINEPHCIIDISGDTLQFPLVSGSGRIRKLLQPAKDGKVLKNIRLSFLGGSEACELASKFCYLFKIVTCKGSMRPISNVSSDPEVETSSFSLQKALDYVMSEARQNGVRLLLTLAYGGKTQYVEWAKEEGVGLSSSNDSFFYDPSIHYYYKSYVKAVLIKKNSVLIRKNSITGIEYKDDPTILGWELINESCCITDISGDILQTVLTRKNSIAGIEYKDDQTIFGLELLINGPRCITDISGYTLQDWIIEMPTFVKLIYNRHLMTVGLEGFYGLNSPKRLSVNSQFWASDLGADFIRNSKEFSLVSRSGDKQKAISSGDHIRTAEVENERFTLQMAFEVEDFERDRDNEQMAFEVENFEKDLVSVKTKTHLGRKLFKSFTKKLSSKAKCGCLF